MKNSNKARDRGQSTAGPDPGRRRSTGIEWTDHTWNPFAGCSIHSAGCTNCYAMRLAARIEAFGTTPAYADTTRIVNGSPIWTGRINKASAATWRKPLAIKPPARFFVNSMSDFFHGAAPDEWRLEALAIMHSTPRHQYQVLTKRPENVGPFLARTGAVLPANVWLGATVERRDMTQRTDILRAVPAAVRFLSLEPLLGPLGALELAGVHWAIVGGESGAGARPMRIEWVREIIEQCVAARVAVFFKQWGKAANNPIAREPPDERSPHTGSRRVAALDRHGKGGGLVDGLLWRQFPNLKVLPNSATERSRE